MDKYVVIVGIVGVVLILIAFSYYYFTRYPAKCVHPLEGYRVKRCTPAVHPLNACRKEIPNVQIVEHNIENTNDDKWRRLWKVFEEGCNFPNQDLLREHMPERADLRPVQRVLDIMPADQAHAECFQVPDKKKWDAFEMTMKRLPPSGPMAQNGWLQNNYKFRRNQGHEYSHRVAQILEEILDESPTFRGNFYYPPGGCREWHTNRSDIPGWRLYIIKNEPRESCVFHILDEDTQKVVAFKDSRCMIRLFKVDSQKPLWHNVVSNGHRWSMGFAISENAARKISSKSIN
jgi:hypothetical protein